VAGGQAVRAGIRELRPHAQLLLAPAIELGELRGAAGSPVDGTDRRC
jgi:hypothetical protein